MRRRGIGGRLRLDAGMFRALVSQACMNDMNEASISQHRHEQRYIQCVASPSVGMSQVRVGSERIGGSEDLVDQCPGMTLHERSARTAIGLPVLA